MMRLFQQLICSAGMILIATPTLAKQLPTPPKLQDAVVFWTQIYSDYSSTQGIFHDSADLRKVYAVIGLPDKSLPKSDLLRSIQVQLQTKRVRNALKNLRDGKEPTNALETDLLTLHQKFDTISVAKLRLQTGQKDRFLAGYKRSGKYLPMIYEKLSEKNLPHELAFLPHVESSFTSYARSMAAATGLWQIMPATGKAYGLTINASIDERLDPEYSTEAAVSLLADNYRQLQSWPLAITAYNHGASGMSRAKKQHRNFDEIITDYTSTTFGFASRNFYAELLAARDTDMFIEQHLNIPRDAPEEYSEVRLEYSAETSEVARYFNITEKYLLKLNPSFKTAGIRIPAGVRIHLPENVLHLAKAFKPESLAHCKASEHYVKKGETFSRIKKILSPAAIKKVVGRKNKTLFKGECLETSTSS